MGIRMNGENLGKLEALSSNAKNASRFSDQTVRLDPAIARQMGIRMNGASLPRWEVKNGNVRDVQKSFQRKTNLGRATARKADLMNGEDSHDRLTCPTFKFACTPQLAFSF